VPGISEIPVLGLTFFVLSHSTANNRGRAANFTDTTFSKWEFAVTTLSSTRFVQITAYN
jgi:hypothetical protein